MVVKYNPFLISCNKVNLQLTRILTYLHLAFGLPTVFLLSLFIAAYLPSQLVHSIFDFNVSLCILTLSYDSMFDISITFSDFYFLLLTAFDLSAWIFILISNTWSTHICEFITNHVKTMARGSQDVFSHAWS